MVPLVIINRSKNNEKVWINKQPSSTLFCRPVRFEYIKESVDTVQAEADFIKEKLDNLSPTIIQGCSISHSLEMTMVDGKVATILSEKSNATTSCSICGITTSKMNDLVEVDRKAAEVLGDNFDHGISTFHLWIRYMHLKSYV